MEIGIGVIELTGILVTSASIAEDEKQIRETAAKLATCRETVLDNLIWRSMLLKGAACLNFLYIFLIQLSIPI